MDESIPIHSLAQPGLAQLFGASVLYHPGPDPLQDVLLGAKLEDDAFHSLQMKQIGE
jgi:hypothetical protein